jgi:hypothetical protein
MLTSRMAEFHARKEDRDLFTKWAHATENNLFDHKVIFYPTTNVVAIENKGAPIFFAPFQAVIMLESLAPQPGLSPGMTAAALSKFIEGIVNICRQQRIREVFFVCADDKLADFALGHAINVAGEKIKFTEINGEMVKWAKENGFKPSGETGPIKRTLKLKLPGPEDKLPIGSAPNRSAETP